MRNYAHNMLDMINELLPELHPDLAQLYALLALTTGTHTTREHVHDAWALWKTQRDPAHSCCVPFAELTAEKQSLDEPYAAAIHYAARFASSPTTTPPRTTP